MAGQGTRHGQLKRTCLFYEGCRHLSMSPMIAGFMLHNPYFPAGASRLRPGPTVESTGLLVGAGLLLTIRRFGSPGFLLKILIWNPLEFFHFFCPVFQMESPLTDEAGAFVPAGPNRGSVSAIV